MAGADEFIRLARDFGDAPRKVAAGLFDAYKQSGDDLVTEWQQNARSHFDGHAKRYPESISSEMVLGLSIQVDVGPEDSASNQGFLGNVLELGGQHSPPYLDGARAIPVALAKLDKSADAAIDKSLP